MIYFIPILSVIVSYSVLLLLVLPDNAEVLKCILWYLPFLMGIINFIVVLTVGRKWSRKVLLNSTLIIKYGLIPFYLCGGYLFFCSNLMAAFPSWLWFLFEIAILLLSMLVYGILLGSAPYAVAYIIKAYKEGVHSIGITIVSGICQFLFSFDLLSMMALTLKEKHLVKTTILFFGMMCLSILLFLLDFFT